MCTSSSCVTSGGMKAATTLSTSGSAKAASSAAANSSAEACGGSETGPCVTAQPPADARARTQRPEGVGVADDRDTVALRERLVERQLGDVEELVDVLDPDDAGLSQQRVERLRGHVGDTGAVSGWGGEARHPRAHDDDGLDRRERAGDARELARVAHRLEVEADGVGLLVVDPVLHEVVARDVDAVAGRREHRDAEAAAGRRGEHRDAERTALGEEAEATRLGDDRGERRVEAHRRVVVDDPEAVGARRCACRRGALDDGASPAGGLPPRPPRRSPADRTRSALTPALPQSLTTSMACAAGTTTMARSTGSGTSWMLG